MSASEGAAGAAEAAAEVGDGHWSDTTLGREDQAVGTQTRGPRPRPRGPGPKAFGPRPRDPSPNKGVDGAAAAGAEPFGLADFEEAAATQEYLAEAGGGSGR